MRPITDLLKGMVRGRKAEPFIWTADADEAFEKLKACFTTAPILRLYDPSLPMRMETDTSDYTIASIASQLFENAENGRKAWYFITYYSRKMSFTKRNYNTHNIKLLTIVQYFKK